MEESSKQSSDSSKSKLSKKRICFIFKLLGVILFLFSVVLTEILVRKKIKEFPYLEKVGEIIYNNEWFLKFIRVLGGSSTHIYITLIISFFLSLQEFFSVFTIIFFTRYLSNLLQVIYGNPRSCWEDDSQISICQGTYGNPSNFSMLSTCYYLSIWNIFTQTNFFKEKIQGKIVKYFLLLVGIFLIFLIMLSRMFEQQNTLNEVLLGFFMGVFMHILFYHIFEIQKISSDNFFKFLWSIKIYMYPLFLFFLVLAILICTLVNKKDSDFRERVKKKCAYKNVVYFLNNNGIFECRNLFSLIGIYSGLLFLNEIFKGEKEKNVLVNWNKSRFIRKTLKGLTFCIFSVGLLLFQTYFTKILIENSSLIHLCILSSLSSFLVFLMISSLGFFSGIIVADVLTGREDLEIDRTISMISALNS